jgi:hypothetical protein
MIFSKSGLISNEKNPFLPVALALADAINSERGLICPAAIKRP